MDKDIKFLLVTFLIVLISKIILVLLIPSPSIFGDEYIYTKLARSISNLQFSVHGDLQPGYPPLYSIVLSIAYLAKNMTFIYPLMKVINVFLSSLIIFPAFYLAKEFTNSKNSLLVSVLVSVLPASFVFPAYILSENLFYPLFLTAVFFIYKAFKENKLKWHVLSGILIGLCIFTRLIGFILLILLGILTIWKLVKKDWILFRNSIIPSIIATGIASIWFLRNFFLFGVTTHSALGPYTSITWFSQFSIPAYIAWILLYLGILALATGIIFFITTFASKTNNKNESLLKYITLILIFVGIFIVSKTAAANIIKAETLFSWLVGRPIARYVDIFLPLVMICGFCFYKYKTSLRLKLTSLFLAGILILSSQLVFFKLFPVNNMSLLWAGLSKVGFDKIFGQNLIITTVIFSLIFIGLLSLSYCLLKSKINRKKITALLIVFFLLLSLANYSVIAYNSKTNWHNNEYSQLGLWLADNIEEDSMVLMDIRDCTGLDARDNICVYDNGVSLISFWLNNDIIIANPDEYENYDYVVSKHELDLPVIKTMADTFVYGVSNE